MAGSIARRPIRIGVLILLLAAVITILLIMQLASSSEDDSTISQTGNKPETVETGGDFIPGEDGDPAEQVSTEGPGSAPAGGILSPLFIDEPAGTSPGSATPPDGVTPVPPAPGNLTGQVEDDLGASLPGINVYLADVNGTLSGRLSTTDASGRFSFNGLAPGSYKLYFSDPASAYAPGWYGAQGSPTGTAIQVQAGQITDVKHAMEPVTNPTLGSITGRVTADCASSAGSCDTGVGNVLVLAMSVVKNNGLQLTLRGTAVTDSSGYYRVDNLPPGDYMISFNPPEGKYAFQWYRGQNSFTTAEILPLSEGDTIGKVDAHLANGGTVSGVVSGEGSPLYLALVDIYDEAGVIVDSVATDTTGGFVSARLPAGNYKIKARAQGDSYQSEWYNDKHDFSSADLVTVNDGQQTTGIAIDLEAKPAQVTTVGPVGGPKSPPAGAPAQDDPASVEDGIEGTGDDSPGETGEAWTDMPGDSGSDHQDDITEPAVAGDPGDDGSTLEEMESVPAAAVPA